MIVQRQSDRFYHDLLSPSETADARLRARKVADEIVAPRAAAIANGDERTDGFPRDVFGALGSAGLFGVGFSADVGGQDLAHAAAATAATIEELAYDSSSIAAVFDVHCILSGNALNQGIDD